MDQEEPNFDLGWDMKQSDDEIIDGYPYEKGMKTDYPKSADSKAKKNNEVILIGCVIYYNIVCNDIIDLRASSYENTQGATRVIERVLT